MTLLKKLGLLGTAAAAVLALGTSAQAERPNRNLMEPLVPMISQETLPPLEERLDVAGNVYPYLRSVNVTLVNNTGSSLTYQAVGGTRNVDLASGESRELTGLEIPLTLTFYQQDGSFLRPELMAEGDEITLSFESTGVFAEDRRAMVVTEEGNIFLM